MKVLARGFEGVLPGREAVGMVLTADVGTPPEALEQMDRIGAQALEREYPGVRGVRAVWGWAEHELPDPGDDQTEQ